MSYKFLNLLSIESFENGDKTALPTLLRILLNDDGVMLNIYLIG